MSVPYLARTRIDGEWTPIEYSREFTVTAPERVAPGEEFTVVFASAPILALAAFNRTLTDLRIAYRVSGQAAVLEWELRGGDTPGGLEFTAERQGADLVVRFGGTIAGGVEVAVPDLVVTVRAEEPGTVTTSPGGSGFDRPAFGWTREHAVNGQWDPFQCYVPVDAPVVFTTTLISS
ncbi:hypothetical protein ACFYY8_02160 [Streptosporangium sp. NPDC001559]|uniref:hypothetical protein n=1 Tax=Streptosporangium sp. NPDC001559 TaxID=3366187 RepID=UPI0036EAF506